jgi:alpha-beta hydrolase superfamily lysophospholipase
MHYDAQAKGDWGLMQATDSVTAEIEELVTPDGIGLFLRSYQTNSSDILLILHGLGAHSGWFIDMCNHLAALGLTVYAIDHRGFGHSKGLPAHIDRYQTYLEDIGFIIAAIRKLHPAARLYLLGHSMGAIFATYFAAEHSELLAGITILNPWVADHSQVPLGASLAILIGGIFKSKRYWQVAGGTEVMTTNPQAILMLENDPYWRRKQTASFLLQILQMRLGILKQATRITIPALVMQAEADKSITLPGSKKLYEALASSDKTRKTYPNYAHDSEFENDRSQMDNDLASWIQEHSAKTSEVASQ